MMGSAHRARLAAALIGAGAAVLIALAWLGASAAILAEQHEAQAHASADVANQALIFEDQLRRELLVVDQTLRILEVEWEANPTEFDLSAWMHRALVLPDVSLHIFIADANGIVRASTQPGTTGGDVSARDYFRTEAALDHDDERMFIGPTTRGLITNRWQMNMVRRLDKDGRFAGVIGADYDTAALGRFYRQADLGEMGMIALVGASDGKLRALVGPTAVEPGYDISGSAMYQALLADPNGRWIGPSAVDGVRRIHAFRTVADRNLAVVVAFDTASVLGTSHAFTRSAQFFAGGTSLFVLVVACGVLREIGMARARERALDADRATLAAANADLDAARRQADRKTAQLETTLGGMWDGVSVVDGDMKLVAWNEPFAALAGVPRELLKIGASVEEIVRAQALSGEFGEVDIEPEVARRMAFMRSGQVYGTTERIRPNGQAIELRRRRLPGGGFVTLYIDITARKQAEEAMRRARELAEAATEAKSRFVATVSHEIRTPLNTLLNSLRLLSETTLPRSAQPLLQMANQAGDGLLALINDILEMSRMEAGQLAVRPSAFALRPLLEGVAALFGDQATARPIAITIGPAVPDLIHSDAGRVRQILLNLLSNAVKFAAPGTVRLIAELEAETGRRLRIVVRDPGPALTAAERARLFQPFSRLERAETSAATGSGLGLAISRGLASLLDAEVGCDAAPDGGNDFWLALPLETTVALPLLPALSAPPGPLPRTRILVVDDVLPNQIVLATMLRRAGHCVDVARSGEAALARLRENPYDIVFMDLRMPGLSGLDATRQIRAMAGPAATIPIVALSADAAPQDHARAIAVGMQELLAKPVDRAQLRAVIARLVWRGHPGRTTTRPGGVAPTLSVGRIAELRSNLAGATLCDLAEECLSELRQRMVALRASLEGGDLQRVQSQSHAMVGLAASYGALALEQRLRELSEAARAGKTEQLGAIAPELDGELDRAAAALRSALASEMAAG